MSSFAVVEPMEDDDRNGGLVRDEADERDVKA
jgi:hypothetical protein